MWMAVERLYFLCRPRCIKDKQVISSSQNFLFIFMDPSCNFIHMSTRSSVYRYQSIFVKIKDSFETYIYICRTIRRHMSHVIITAVRTSNLNFLVLDSGVILQISNLDNYSWHSFCGFLWFLRSFNKNTRIILEMGQNHFLSNPHILTIHVIFDFNSTLLKSVVRQSKDEYIYSFASRFCMAKCVWPRQFRVYTDCGAFVSVLHCTADEASWIEES
jgi:hypothetical protein